MKKTGMVVVLILLLFLVFSASAEDEFRWIEDPHDEINYLYRLHFQNLEMRIPDYYNESHGSDRVHVYFSVQDGDVTKDVSFSVILYQPDSKDGKILRKHEKKYGIEKSLIFILESQLTKKIFDSSLVYKLAGTPEGITVYSTHQLEVRNGSSAFYYSYAGIYADGCYQLICASGSTPEKATLGKIACLQMLFYQGKKVYYDNLRDGTPYSDGYESDVHITNPLRKKVSITVMDPAYTEGSSSEGWKKCDIPEYKLGFSCSPGVILLTQDSADEEWISVYDLDTYSRSLEEAKEMLEPLFEDYTTDPMYDAFTKKQEEYAAYALSAVMDTKRSIEDGSAIQFSPYTVALITPEKARGWNLTINISESREYAEGTDGQEDNLNHLLSFEIAEEESCGRAIDDSGITTVGSHQYAYLHSSSDYGKRYVYMTYHDGREIDVILRITEPAWEEYLTLLPFVEDLLAHFDYYK